jgi:hypothetical protein
MVISTSVVLFVSFREIWRVCDPLAALPVDCFQDSEEAFVCLLIDVLFGTWATAALSACKCDG